MGTKGRSSKNLNEIFTYRLGRVGRWADLQSHNDGDAVFEADLVVGEAAEIGTDAAAQVLADEPVGKRVSVMFLTTTIISFYFGLDIGRFSDQQANRSKKFPRNHKTLFATITHSCEPIKLLRSWVRFPLGPGSDLDQVPQGSAT